MNGHGKTLLKITYWAPCIFKVGFRNLHGYFYKMVEVQDFVRNPNFVKKNRKITSHQTINAWGEPITSYMPFFWLVTSAKESLDHDHQHTNLRPSFSLSLSLDIYTHTLSLTPSIEWRTYLLIWWNREAIPLREWWSLINKRIYKQRIP